jgi:hypothetical protein
VAAVASMLASTAERARSQALGLTELSYAVSEDAISAVDDPRAERCAATLGRIARLIEPVYELAEELAGTLLATHRLLQAQGRQLEAADLGQLGPTIRRALVDTGEPAFGAGVATAPGLLADRALWMEWWTQTSQGPARLEVQLEPDQPGFYDYRTAMWYVEAAADVAPHLVRPHFDQGGTNDHMITVSVPIIADGAFIALAGAEMTLTQLGDLTRPALRGVGVPAALVTPDGALVCGEGLDEARVKQLWGAVEGMRKPEASFTEPSPGVTLTRSASLPWWLLADWNLT